MRHAAANLNRTRRGETRSLIRHALAALLLASLTACESAPTTQNSADDAPLEKIRLRDLASRSDPALINGPTPTELPPQTRIPQSRQRSADPAESDIDAAAPGAPTSTSSTAVAVSKATFIGPAQQPLPLVAQLLTVPRDDPRLGLALTMIGNLDLDPALQHLWHRNGLRIGIVKRDSLPLFLANLPKAIDVSVTKMQATATWTPVTLIDKLRGTQRLRAFDATDQPKVLKFVGGEYQMLIKMLPPADAASAPRIQIMPHHYSVTSTLLPRSPEQKVLDGVSFDDLLIAHPISADEIWVITAHIAGPIPAEADDADDTAKPADAKSEPRLAAGVTPKPATPAAAATPAETNAETEFSGPRVQPLSQALFTGTRGTKNAQVILLLGLEKR